MQLFILPFFVHMAMSSCSNKGKQDQRLAAAHGRVHTSRPLCMHTLDVHGALAEAQCVCSLQGREKEKEQKSWNKRTLASISRAAERNGGVRKRIHALCPTTNSRPPLPSHPIISIRDTQWMKGTTPQWQHFSLQTYAEAFRRLLNCTWYRQGPFSFKSKTDCFSLGRGLLDKKDDKAGTVQL